MSHRNTRSCQQAGCRAMVVGGTKFCPAHTKPASSASESASKANLYSKLMTREELEMLEKVGETGLEGDIWIARLVVVRLFEQGDMEAVGRMLYVVRALVAEHRKETGDQAAGIVNGIQKILDEFGLTEEGGLTPGLN